MASHVPFACATALTLLLAVAPARAEFVPVTPEDVPRLAARHAKLYVARPTSNRGPGAIEGPSTGHPRRR